jgi:hypothetical protein
MRISIEHLGEVEIPHYLSAFVSAAHSVSDVMKREYKRKAPGFEEWLKKVEGDRTREEQELFNLTIDMRHNNVHEGRLKARASYQAKIAKQDAERLAKKRPTRPLILVQGTNASLPHGNHQHRDS